MYTRLLQAALIIISMTTVAAPTQDMYTTFAKLITKDITAAKEQARKTCHDCVQDGIEQGFDAKSLLDTHGMIRSLVEKHEVDCPLFLLISDNDNDSTVTNKEWMPHTPIPNINSNPMHFLHSDSKTLLEDAAGITTALKHYPSAQISLHFTGDRFRNYAQCRHAQNKQNVVICSERFDPKTITASMITGILPPNFIQPPTEMLFYEMIGRCLIAELTLQQYMRYITTLYPKATINFLVHESKEDFNALIETKPTPTNTCSLL